MTQEELDEFNKVINSKILSVLDLLEGMEFTNAKYVLDAASNAIRKKIEATILPPAQSYLK